LKGHEFPGNTQLVGEGMDSPFEEVPSVTWHHFSLPYATTEGGKHERIGEVFFDTLRQASMIGITSSCIGIALGLSRVLSLPS